MTVSSIAPTASMQAKASILIAEQATWSRGRSKQTGQAFWLIPGSKGTAHYTTSTGCTCRSFLHRGVCSHVVAVQLHERQQPALKPKARYEDLFEACRDCGDLADGLDGRCSKCASDAEWRARRDARSR
jgi:hypothetical protein